MNIAYIITSLRNAGPIIVVQDIVRLMKKHGHNCVVYYFDEIKEINFDCPCYKINFYSKIPFHKYDIVHTHGTRPDFFVLLKKPLHTQVVFITSIHSYIYQDYKYTYGNIKGFVLAKIALMLIKRHNCLMVLSNDAVLYYKRFIKKTQQIEYAYNTRVVDTKKDLSSLEILELKKFKGEDKLIGTNCSISQRKGIDLLIMALSKIENIKLFVVGDGPYLNELKKIIEQHNMQERVFFAGYKPDAYRYLKYYDIYAIPSRSEGFPLSMLEAASLGKKIVCSNLPVFKEIFNNGEVSMFDLENTESLKKAIIRAINDNNLGINAKEKFDKCYSPEVIYNMYIRIYSKLIKEKKIIY